MFLHLNQLKFLSSETKEIFEKCSSYFDKGERYILDSNKYINNSFIDDSPFEKNVFEKVIYDIAVESYKLQYQRDFTDKHKVIFWFKTENNCCRGLHYDDILANSEDEKSLMNSILYLNTTEWPTFYTKVNNKMKDEEIKEFSITSAKENNVITFDVKNMLHGAVDFDNDKLRGRKLLVIQVFNTGPVIKLNSPVFHYLQLFQYFDNTPELREHLKRICLNDVNSKLIVLESDKVIKKNVDLATDQQLITDNKLNNNMILKVLENAGDYDQLTVKLTKQQNDKITTIDNSEINLGEDKYRQRFRIPNYLCDVVCKWLIREAEKTAEVKGGWDTKRHENYPTTDIEISEIKTVFPFIFESLFSDLKEKIEKSYCINIHTFNVEDCFIVKYDMDNQKSLDMHNDGCNSNMTASILLSDEFEGGGIYYEDGCTIYPEKGDLLIHNKTHKHAVLELTKGQRYIIVFFIKVN